MFDLVFFFQLENIHKHINARIVWINDQFMYNAHICPFISLYIFFKETKETKNEFVLFVFQTNYTKLTDLVHIFLFVSFNAINIRCKYRHVEINAVKLTQLN